MKHLTIFLIGSLILTTGCATPLGYTNKEQCALEGMKLEGASVGAGASSGFNTTTVPGHGNAFGTSSSSSAFHAVSCSVPKQEDEKCEIRALQEIVKPKVEYNESVGTWRTASGIGYFLFVVPGFLVKIGADKAADAALEKSREIAETKTCPKASWWKKGAE